MRRRLALALVSLFPALGYAQTVAGSSSAAPTVASNDWRVTLTIFRSPGTGLQISKGHLAAFVVHYPTVIKRDGEQRNTNFLRVGLAAYAKPDDRTSPYASLSFAPSLTRGWSNSMLAEVGVRQRFGSRYKGQLGAAVLYAPHTKQTRLNPTIGLGVQF